MGGKGAISKADTNLLEGAYRGESYVTETNPLGIRAYLTNDKSFTGSTIDLEDYLGIYMPPTVKTCSSVSQDAPAVACGNGYILPQFVPRDGKMYHYHKEFRIFNYNTKVETTEVRDDFCAILGEGITQTNKLKYIEFIDISFSNGKVLQYGTATMFLDIASTTK